MASVEPGRQARKTRAAVLAAFHDLVLERRYPDIRVADILNRADVGRSTFYEHFRNKDDVLRQSLSGPLGLLADAVKEDCDEQRLQRMLDHFHANSRLARGLLNGPSSPQVVAVLAGLVEERMATLSSRSEAGPTLPLDLAAMQAAESLLGLVRAWLNRGAPCPSATVAMAMHRIATASAQALFGSPAGGRLEV